MGPAPTPSLVSPRGVSVILQVLPQAATSPRISSGLHRHGKITQSPDVRHCQEIVLAAVSRSVETIEVGWTSKGSDYMRFAKHLMFVGLRFAILCSLLHLFGGVSTTQTTKDVTVANTTKPLSDEIGARRGNSEAQNSSPLSNKRTVHVLFGLDAPESG